MCFSLFDGTILVLGNELVYINVESGFECTRVHNSVTLRTKRQMYYDEKKEKEEEEKHETERKRKREAEDKEGHTGWYSNPAGAGNLIAKCDCCSACRFRRSCIRTPPQPSPRQAICASVLRHGEATACFSLHLICV